MSKKIILDETAKLAKNRWDSLAKPLGSLGKLEELTIKLAGIQGDHPKTSPRAVAVFASDNGVLDEGFNPVPKEVTAMQLVNMANGVAAISVLCKHTDTMLELVDVGVASQVDHPLIVNKKIASGTNNMANGPAMSREQAEKAFSIGVETANKLADSGAMIIGIGEMGIGNTTTSSAVISCLCHSDIADTTGRGVGLTDEMYYAKIDAIKRSIIVNKPDPLDAMDVVSKVGGFDIVAMAGCYYGAWERGVACMVDGVISMAAALVAAKIEPEVFDVMLASHVSYEPAYAIACKELGLNPCLNLDMRLGEGSGCPLMFMILDAAIALYNNMANLNSTGLCQDDLVDTRE